MVCSPAYLAACLLLSVLIHGSAACSAEISQEYAPVHRYKYTVVKSHPHPADDFTQGLVYTDGKLYESVGLYGRSAISVRTLTAAVDIKRVPMPPRYFGEGLTAVDDRLVQLTYHEQTGFVYERDSLNVLRKFHYKGEGWGLTYDGQHLIMSDGSSQLRFLDPDNFRKARVLKITRLGIEVPHLNELEYIEGRIYANLWLRDIIVEIDPVTGHVTGEIDLSELSIKHFGSPEAVLNGIAYNPDSRTLLVTGKYWSALYEIKLQSRD
jgi:glutamine cyclotransferase